MGISEGINEQTFTKKQAERILKDALKKQYTLPKSPRELGIDSSQLVEIAQEAGINQGNINQSIRVYNERRNSRSKAWKRLVRGVAISPLVAVVGLASYGISRWGINAMSNGTSERKQPEYVNATIKGIEGGQFIFRLDDNSSVEYRIRVSCNIWDCERRNSFYGIMKENSKIGIEKEKINELDKGPDPGIKQGSIDVNDVIMISR